MRARLAALLCCLLASGPLALATPVAAHGGGVPRVTGAQAGQYRVYVWTEPATPRNGDTLHVTVAVTLADGDGMETPVTDAAVRVEFAGPEQEAASVVQAQPGAGAGGVFYEADSRLDAKGEWSVMVIVDGDLGAGEFPAGVTVAPALIRTGWIASLAAVTLALAGAAAAVVLVLRRRARRASALQTDSAAGGL